MNPGWSHGLRDLRGLFLRDQASMEVTAGAASQLLVQTTSNGIFLPVLRVTDVSYVGRPGQGAVMMVLADNDHFVIAYLTPLARQQLSRTYPRRVQTNYFVRLVAWETETRQNQPVVFISSLIIYATTEAQPADAVSRNQPVPPDH
jgi:hypothetical protein